MGSLVSDFSFVCFPCKPSCSEVGGYLTFPFVASFYRISPFVIMPPVSVFRCIDLFDCYISATPINQQSDNSDDKSPLPTVQRHIQM